MPTDRGEVIDALASLSTSQAESFFIEHRLGSAFSQPERGWGKRKRVNEALIAAEARGDIDAVLDDARKRFGTSTKPMKTLRKVDVSPTRTARQDTPLVFISHAEADKHLAEAIQDLLRLGTKMSADNLFCTSLPGVGVPVGTHNYNGHIRDRLTDAKLVIPIITQAFMESTMCLIELGGVWGAKLPMFPIVVPPVSFAEVEAGIGKAQMAKIDNPDDLGRLHDAVLAKIELLGKTDMWNKQQARFLQGLPDLRAKLAKSEKVPAADHAALIRQLTAT
ncbi:MAG: toll/interleukin-1 receptor domain-containing protein [Actinomycetota bacterium]|nr:toll/interleukin-1 receptor domain-containing protein [Actinomycetota bacterium]